MPKSRRSTTNRGRSHIHLHSRVETTLTLKNTHLAREIYPIPISSIFDPASVGTDEDIRMIGYTLSFIFATGNKTNTVSCNLGHSGEWVRRSTSATRFNQMFTTRTLNTSKVTFSKRLLPESEREFLSPQKGDNFINLLVDDSCGVLPGVTVKVIADIHFIRPHLPTLMIGSTVVSTDRYSDQDVNQGPVKPPTITPSVPLIIEHGGNLYHPDSNEPISYKARVLGLLTTYCTVDVASPYNKVGLFVTDVSSDKVQGKYTAAGYDGTITVT